MEVVFTSECSGQLWNTCVWDPLTGTSLRTFKGGISCSKTLNLVGGDYMVSSQKDKPILQVWALNRQDQLTSKMIMPGIVRVLTVSPCWNFCVGAVEEQLLVWHVSSGKLLAALRRHYQDVSNIQFTSDSCRFVSAGSDGLVLVWSLETVTSSADCEPDTTWSDHSLPVTDLHITKSLVQPLVFTTSLDQTCKVHDLNTGQTLLSVQFSEPLYSVVVDHAEETCFVGAKSGSIFSVDLLDPPRNVEQSIEEMRATSGKFIGHTKTVSSLSVSMDGSQLLSGSEDGDARVWDIASGQCIRILAHRGPLTNARFAPRYRHLETDKLQPRTVLSTFEKKKDAKEPLNVQVLVHQRPLAAASDATVGKTQQNGARLSEGQLVRNDIKHLKRINQQLYSVAVEEIFKFGVFSRKKRKTTT